MKNFKKLGSLLCALALVFSCFSNVAFATDTLSIPEEPQDWGTPVSVSRYIDENGNEVVERLYFVSDNEGIATCASSGSGWFKNEKDVANTTEGTMYAKGYFVWGNGNVSVSSPSGGNNGKMAKVSDESVTTGTGKYGAVFNKYAYVTYSFITTNGFGVQQYNTVTMRLSESGNQI